MTRFLQMAAALLLLGVTASSHAALIYKVSDTSRINCSGAPHGLWTGRDLAGQCANYFSIQKDTRLIVDSSYGLLTGTAINPFGDVAKISLLFLDRVETHKYKREGGIAWNPADDTPDIDFFRRVSGVITLLNKTYLIDRFAGGYGFQFGLGANAKVATEYGASAWLTSSCGLGGYGLACPTSGHWDLNLQLTKVPEPGTMALMFVGLAGLLLMRRRGSRA